MAYNDKEISTQDGRPVALYALKWGDTYWRYTSADRDITREELVDNVLTEVTYTARAVSDSGMVQGSSAQNDFTMDCPTDLPICALYRGTPPSETIWLTVRRMHFGETDAPIYWKGTVNNVKRVDAASAQILGRPLSASFKRAGLRLCWTRECPHFLYDSECRVDPADYEHVGTILTLTGSSITLAVAPDEDSGYYDGGYLSWEANGPGTIERRMIEKHTIAVLQIFGLTDGLVIGDTIKLYPGCNRTPTMCDEKFDNIDNYGGWDKMPGKSPFGTSIF